ACVSDEKQFAGAHVAPRQHARSTTGTAVPCARATTTPASAPRPHPSPRPQQFRSADTSVRRQLTQAPHHRSRAPRRHGHSTRRHGHSWAFFRAGYRCPRRDVASIWRGANVGRARRRRRASGYRKFFF
ncbi:hypothetical protein PFISCL1PPCAC_18837, partial [Pristionchus fissidentatus]